VFLIPGPLELIPRFVRFSPSFRQLFGPPSLAKGTYSSSRGCVLNRFCQCHCDVLCQLIDHCWGYWFIGYRAINRGEEFNYLGFEEIPVRLFEVVHWNLFHSLRFHIECCYNRVVIRAMVVIVGYFAPSAPFVPSVHFPILGRWLFCVVGV